MLSGALLCGFGIGSFLTPNKIVAGGASGLSTVFYYAAGIPVGLGMFVLNLLFLLLGLKILGKKFIMKTLAGSAVLSLFTQIFACLPIYTKNLMLSAIFGGVLMGVGIGINFAANSSTGGTEIIGRIVQKKFPAVPIGKLLMIVDGVIILASLIVFKNVELILYGIIALVLSSYAIDMVINALNVSRLAFVITDKGAEISKTLVTTSSRGVTLIDVKGVYTDTDKQMLFCALKESELEAFQKKILNIDPDSFIVFAESQKIKGKGFYLYK